MKVVINMAKDVNIYDFRLFLEHLEENKHLFQSVEVDTILLIE